jgi:hypothetical protein
MIVVALLLLAVAAAAAVTIVRWRAARRDAFAPIPLVFPMNAGIAWENVAGQQPTAPPVRTVEQSRTVEPERVESTFAPPSTTTFSAPVMGDRSVNVPLSVDRDNLVPVSAETVRFHRPNDDVVQLLPGHLEVLAGDTRHQEIRFVRVQGQQPQLILGRNPGRSPQHISLNSSTVSRQHARLAFAGGKWAVANLSKTNPVVVNDEELSNIDGERPLADGDRIELGEVVLRFHAQ